MLTALNPATGDIVREVESDSDDAVEAKLAASEEAYRKWKEKSFAERAALLNAVARLMRDEIETLAPVMTEEMGKPIKESRGEVNKSAWCAEHYAANAEAYLARQVIERDAEVDEMYNSLFRELLTYMMEDPRWITLGAHLLFIAKNIERIGDHATNIAEQVFYSVTGETLVEDRAKGDETPYLTQEAVEEDSAAQAG